ncbi:unnamed protein product, partial [marine sediment metagenome]
MKAFKIRTATEWSTDCMIIFKPTRDEAIEVFRDDEVECYGKPQDSVLEIEEWDVKE